MQKRRDKQVIIIGGEGNGGVVAACIEDNIKRFGDREWSVLGFLNDYEEGKKINGYPVLGGIDAASRFLQDDNIYFIYAIHMIGRNFKSEQVFHRVNVPFDRYAVITHGSAFIADNAVLEPGVFVMANSYVGPKARIGHCSLIMSNSMIGHDTKVGPLCHFSVGSITSSYVEIGKVADVTLGARILEKRKIGDYAVAGAGALVTKDIPEAEVHVGSPAKFLKMVRRD